VVEIGGPWSRELCGGTHVSRSSQIGTIVVTSEFSVGSGNRRVEAVTGLEGFRYLAKERTLVRDLGELLKVPADDLVPRVSDLVGRVRALEKELARARVQSLLSQGGELAAAAADIGGVRYVGRVVADAGAGDVRTLALDVRGRLSPADPGVVTIVGVADGKPAVVVALNDRARESGLRAGDLVKVAAGALGGSGGGKDDVAQGGGTDPAGADDALSSVERAISAARTAR
jgi:alanyl-tRNA synthetase